MYWFRAIKLREWKKMCICIHMLFKSCVGFVLLNCLNATKKNIWNTKYTIQHIIERSQTTKCIQYNIHDTKSCELPNYLLYISYLILRIILYINLLRYLFFILYWLLIIHLNSGTWLQLCIFIIAGQKAK